MNEQQARIWLVVAAFGALFALLNLVNLVFVAGDVVRDVVTVGLGVLLAILGYAKSRGRQEARR